jgi:curli biogenesis system outer membrane secretion channel CsgG
MKGVLIKILMLAIIIVFFLFSLIEAQVIRPKARGTPSQGPTIEEAQKEDAMGGKARVAVTRFENKSAKGGGEIGTGMAEMLSHALFATNRFIVLERGAIGDVIAEQDFSASGRVKPETAPRIGEIEGADLLIMGTITEFEPGSAGAGGGVGGVIPIPIPGRRIPIRIGGVGGGVKVSHVAMIVKVVDAKTSRLLASEQVEGKATDIGGLTGMVGGPLAGVFGGYSKTPMEKAIRITIEEAVRLIVAKTPAEYFRPEGKRQHKQAPSTQLESSTQTPTSSSSAKSPSPKSQVSEPQIVYINWPKVSLREGPGTEYKILGEISKGTVLAILDEKGPWIKVKLEDGREGWVGKATTSLNP